MYHQVLGGCQRLVDATVVTRAEKLGLQELSWCCE